MVCCSSKEDNQMAQKQNKIMDENPAEFLDKFRKGKARKAANAPAELIKTASYTDHLKNGTKSKVLFAGCEVYITDQSYVKNIAKKSSLNLLDAIIDFMKSPSDSELFLEETVFIKNSEFCNIAVEFINFLEEVFNYNNNYDNFSISDINEHYYRVINSKDYLIYKNSAIEINNHKKSPKLPLSKMVIINGDSDVASDGDLIDFYESGLEATIKDSINSNSISKKELGPITFSFECLSQLLLSSKDIQSSLKDGTLELVDYTLDETRKFGEKEGKALKSLSDEEYGGGDFPLSIRESGAALNHLQPESGFTPIVMSMRNNSRNKWHRPAYTLFREKYKNKFHYYLLGIDEDQYFGVELPEKVGSVSEAFEALKPKEVKNHPNKKHIQRQGEWFMIPVTVSENLPGPHESVTSVDGEITLPREDLDSNEHVVVASELMVDSNLTVYAYKPTISAEDHSMVSSSNIKLPKKDWYGHGWCKFVCNTALRSVSIDGVD